MIAAAPTGTAAFQAAPITDPSQVLSAIDIPTGRSGRMFGVRLADGTWSLGHRHGEMIRMPAEAACWLAACLALVADLPGKQESFRRGCMWALYNPGDQLFNLVAGTACVCVAGHDKIRVIARWMEAAQS